MRGRWRTGWLGVVAALAMALAIGGGRIEAASGTDGGGQNQNQTGQNGNGNQGFGLSNGTSVKVLPAAADAFVDATAPRTNYGHSTDLNVLGTPEQRSYVRFDLSSVSNRTVVQAVLVLGPEKDSNDGFDVRGSSSAWGETTITYTNAPAPGALLGRSGPVQTNKAKLFDVSTYAASAGTSASFALVASVPTGRKDLELTAREDANHHQPYLIVVTRPGTPGPTPPPSPTITANPPASSTSASATFSFADARASATFVCKLDSAAYAPCTSPTAYNGLANGSHTFSVEATDAGGTSAPTFYTWTVAVPDTTAPPAPVLDTWPPNPSASTSAAFTFHDAEAGVVFRCALDGATPATCVSGQSYSGLAPGTHTFKVAARDVAGNTSPETSFSWAVAPADTTPPPAPSITSKPDNPSGGSNVAFAFTDGEANVTFQCSIDGSAPVSCNTGAVTYDGLPPGKHTFAVTARDAAGNTSPAATYEWVVQQEFVVNGDFENGVAGWSSYQGTVVATTGGIVRGGAARVSFNPPASGEITLYPSVGTNDGVPKPPVASATAGWVYTYSSWVIGPAGRTICQRVRERNPGDAIVNEVSNCVIATGAWQRLGPRQYTPSAAGDHITTFITLPTGLAGDTFTADGISLIGGPAADAPPQEFVVNGDFEAGIAGWSSFHGTVSPATGGVVGPGAAHVSLDAGATGQQLSLYPSVGTNDGTSKPPVSTTKAGWVYTASGYIKARAGQQACQRVRERNASAVIVNDVATCVTATGAWQKLGPLVYTPVSPGGSLTTFLYLSNPAAGDGFDGDGISLLGSPAGPSPPPTGDPVVAVAGDVACALGNPSYLGGAGDPVAHRCYQQATGDLIRAINPNAVLVPGDLQYDCGEQVNYPVYWESWGSFKAITYPVPGNHDYGLNPGCAANNADAYYAYWGSRGAGATGQGYYSFDIGTWHIVALNSECTQVGGCDAGKPETVWLQNDLAASHNPCTLVYWHEPTFSTGFTGIDHTYDTWWQIVAAAHVDLVLHGHDHTYQRWTPMDAAGNPNPAGTREVIVGTGGEEFTATPGPDSRGRLAASNGDTFGVLKLTLHPGSYDAQFVAASAPGNGTFGDSFSAPCTT